MTIVDDDEDDEDDEDDDHDHDHDHDEDNDDDLDLDLDSFPEWLCFKSNKVYVNKTDPLDPYFYILNIFID